MAWLIILVLFVALFFFFPRKTAVAGGIALAAFAGIFAFVFYDDSQSRERRAAMVEAVKIDVRYDEAACTTTEPLYVAISNGNEETLKAIEFRLAGFRPGHSEPLFDSISDSFSTDRIIAHNEQFSLCVALPKLSSKALQARLSPDELPTQTLEWVATHKSTGLVFE